MFYETIHISEFKCIGISKSLLCGLGLLLDGNPEQRQPEYLQKQSAIYTITQTTQGMYLSCPVAHQVSLLSQPLLQYCLS